MKKNVATLIQKMAVEFSRDKRQLYHDRKWKNNETSQDNVPATKFSVLR